MEFKALVGYADEAVQSGEPESAFRGPDSFLQQHFDTVYGAGLAALTLEERVTGRDEETMQALLREASDHMAALLNPEFTHPDFSEVEEYIARSPIVSSIQYRDITLSERSILRVTRHFTRVKRPAGATKGPEHYDHDHHYEYEVIPTDEENDIAIPADYHGLHPSAPLSDSNPPAIARAKEDLDTLKNVCKHFDVPITKSETN